MLRKTLNIYIIFILLLGIMYFYFIFLNIPRVLEAFIKVFYIPWSMGGLKGRLFLLISLKFLVIMARAKECIMGIWYLLGLSWASISV